PKSGCTTGCSPTLTPTAATRIFLTPSIQILSRQSRPGLNPAFRLCPKTIGISNASVILSPIATTPQSYGRYSTAAPLFAIPGLNDEQVRPYSRRAQCRICEKLE